MNTYNVTAYHLKIGTRTQIDVDNALGYTLVQFIWDEAEKLSIYFPQLHDTNITAIARTTDLINNIVEGIRYQKLQDDDDKVTVNNILKALAEREIQVVP